MGGGWGVGGRACVPMAVISSLMVTGGTTNFCVIVLIPFL